MKGLSVLVGLPIYSATCRSRSDESLRPLMGSSTTASSTGKPTSIVNKAGCQIGRTGISPLSRKLSNEYINSVVIHSREPRLGIAKRGHGYSLPYRLLSLLNRVFFRR